MRSGIPDRYEKYAAKMGATFADENGREQPFYMGCYGIGISRTLAAIVEQHHDEHGIIWPVSVAPVRGERHLLDKKGEGVRCRRRFAEAFAAEDIDVVFDDRAERAGVKFADNDLMGFPYQVVVGKRGLAAGTVEVKNRSTGAPRCCGCRCRRRGCRPREGRTCIADAICTEC